VECRFAAFGFIGDDSGGPDIFLPLQRCNQRASIRQHQEGERLTFDVESTREGKTRASNVRRAGLKAERMMDALPANGIPSFG